MCRKFFCHRTDEHLIVEKTSVSFETKKKLNTKSNKNVVSVSIKCPVCDWTTKIYLKKLKKEPADSQRDKFSIFQSRF